MCSYLLGNTKRYIAYSSLCIQPIKTLVHPLCIAASFVCCSWMCKLFIYFTRVDALDKYSLGKNLKLCDCAYTVTTVNLSAKTFVDAGTDENNGVVKKRKDYCLSSTTIMVSVERTLSSLLIRQVTISFSLSIVSALTLATMS